MATGYASATELTFDGTAFDNTGGTQLIPQAYGDRVTSTTVGAFEYGPEGGFTPNVEVSYSTSGGNELEYAESFFGTLVGVAFNPDPNGEFFEINFQADPGFEVALSSLNIAKFGGPNTLTDIIVTDGDDTELLRFGSVSFATGSNERNFFLDANFDPALQAPELTVRVVTSLESIQWGVDNITFSQVVIPEPSSALLLAVGGLVLRRCRRA
ncbi:MAG: PEP-CTERM sorting domain-containing protein [Planctomycetota bacterium]